MKKLIILLFSALLLSSLCYAGQAPITASSDQAKVTENKKQVATKKSVKPKSKKSGKRVKKEGNKICPVSGQKVDGKNFYEYNGKRYGLCCPTCEAAFKADPGKYSTIADKEVAGK